MSETRLSVWLSLVLVGGTLLTFSPVGDLRFLHYDDDVYVTSNYVVRQGLSAEGWTWAWTSFHGSNWFPLTWLSHMLDCQLFGLDPAAHHWVNLLFHACNVLLLFQVLRRLTGQTWRAAVVAALFGLHPLRVESVAWVAERKDVLSTFFGLLALAAYGRYCRRPGVTRYLLVVAAFALSLLAKQMLVTLPFVLLLLDYWPLRRLVQWHSQETVPQQGVQWHGQETVPQQGHGQETVPQQGEHGQETVPQQAETPAAPAPGWRWLILEKVPLLMLSALSALMTVLAQRSEAIVGLDQISLATRLANALVSYVRYLGQMLWPVDLAIFYPYDASRLTPVRVVCSALLLAAVTGLAFAWRRRQPAVLVGWLWYLGTLVPVIGLVQVGEQAMADRYTYVPLIGIFLALTWAVPDSWLQRPVGLAIKAGLAVVLLGCAIMTWFQLPHWQNDVTIWHRALEVNRDNWVAEHGLGWVKATTGHEDEAEQHYQHALKLKPNYALALDHLGLLRLQQGKVNKALGLLNEAVKYERGNALHHNGLGLVLLRKDDLDAAGRGFEVAIRLGPTMAEAYYNLAFVRDDQGKKEAAAAFYKIGRKLDPAFPQWARQMALDRLRTSDPRWRCLPEALFRAQQANAATGKQRPEMLFTLAEALAANGRPVEAAAAAEQGLNTARKAGQLEALTAALAEPLEDLEKRLREYQAAASSAKQASKP